MLRAAWCWGGSGLHCDASPASLRIADAEDKQKPQLLAQDALSITAHFQGSSLQHSFLCCCWRGFPRKQMAPTRASSQRALCSKHDAACDSAGCRMSFKTERHRAHGRVSWVAAAVSGSRTRVSPWMDTLCSQQASASSVLCRQPEKVRNGEEMNVECGDGGGVPLQKCVIHRSWVP